MPRLAWRLTAEYNIRMKIHPPEVVIPEGDPYANALHERKQLGESLTQLIKNVEEGLVIFVDAPWGEGKTTFARMWRAALSDEKYEIIHFDAFAADYMVDPFVAFSGEILELLRSRFPSLKDAGERQEEFKRTAIEVAKRLTGVVVKAGLRAASLGAFDSTSLEELKKLGPEVAGGVAEIGADLVERQIEHYAKERSVLRRFKESLTKVAATVREKQGFPLTIVVDELDRCRPDFALGLLERIKHLFDVPGVSFVLFVNRDQIEGYIRSVYGAKVGARSYLLKFANLFVQLPARRRDPNHDSSFYRYLKTLFDHHGLAEKVGDWNALYNCISAIAAHFELTLREIERMFSVLTLYYTTIPENPPPTTSWWCCLQRSKFRTRACITCC